ncbi:hypothetical protein Rt10032_c09g4029 [Rhodotorula toruloides]|uniref:Acyl-CoA thioesterase-like N-terminal HotDog domain-containing protein n=1 Tax=Rhodotorula toruloides TaxID=5286 RepID=A0A511KI09_RHOTO|nr:hypothetical protein Rt10032_c09g4029 [Rhodotorula toruloides]
MLNLTVASTTRPRYLRDPHPPPAILRSPSSCVFDADISPDWCVGSVGHGGYLLCVLTDAVIRHQRIHHSEHVDPAHLSSQFFSATVPGRAQVEVKVISASKRWTRLDVELWQWTPDPGTSDFVNPANQRILRIQAHYLVTELPEHPQPAQGAASAPVGGLNFLSRPCPLLQHPGEVDMRDGGSHVPEKLRFSNGMRWKEVEVTQPNDGSLAWGAWIDLTGGEDVAELATLVPFFADVAKNGPEMLPEDKKPGPSWYPTMTFSLDFKSRFPLPSPHFGRRTIGLYSTTRTIHEGRHDLTVECWAAPADLGDEKGVSEEGLRKESDGVERWRREEARLVGVSTQMALAVPLEVNHARGRKTLPGESDDSNSGSSDSEGEGGKKRAML